MGSLVLSGLWAALHNITLTLACLLALCNDTLSCSCTHVQLYSCTAVQLCSCSIQLEVVTSWQWGIHKRYFRWVVFNLRVATQKWVKVNQGVILMGHEKVTNTYFKNYHIYYWDWLTMAMTIRSTKFRFVKHSNHKCLARSLPVPSANIRPLKSWGSRAMWPRWKSVVTWMRLKTAALDAPYDPSVASPERTSIERK